MWFIAGLIKWAAYIGVIVIALAIATPAWHRLREGKKQRVRVRRIGEVPNFEGEDDTVKDVRAAQQASLRFLGLPSVHGGRTILNVPAFNPEQEGGWEKRRTVVTASRITALTKQGPVPGEFVELDGGYVLFASNGKAFIVLAHLLTGSEEAQLERERQEAVDKGDPIIPNFAGSAWRIGMACGSHKAGRAGNKTRSTMQVLSVHPDLGKNGLRSCLPANLLESGEHDYYDMRARATDDQNRVLLFFFTGGKWNCFMGRQLGAEEMDRLQALQHRNPVPTFVGA